MKIDDGGPPDDGDIVPVWACQYCSFLIALRARPTRCGSCNLDGFDQIGKWTYRSNLAEKDGD